MHDDKVNKFVVILLVVFISAVFLSMIRAFLMAIFMAGIFAALTRPIYYRLERWLGGRRSLASVLTLLLIIFVVLIPLTILTGVVTGQAIKVGQSVTPWVRAQIEQPNMLSDYLERLPYYEHIMPHSELILRKAGEMVGRISQFLINNLSSATMGAVNFLFMLFTWLYTMYFFLMDGEKLLEKILYYLPLEDRDEQQMLDRFTSVTRATLKGTAVIGILQGGLAGAAFWVVGIPSSAFWGVIMVVLSIIPSVGTAVVWVPAAVILGFNGAIAKGVGLAIFCGLVVGSLDNLLRPILVGKDTQMHELMIFFGTMGGIFMFGMVGVIIGPIVAALFVTVWEIYGHAFQGILPDTGYVLRRREKEHRAAEEPAE
ncbi:AI-2E family transporter [Desulfosarcina ovata subsp. sediminis]|uniref:AI-2E family transporter n=1 Tax=Desulfosarcina ovata subsp. sediminis TaxID=885957 RepID=A0A5K7ZIN2_9BACT|nr:AI-2E family transporter [Desulfosarcina ovata]BBO80741.1 AI-2E family transporter [Desulfosarcina ovata subsp. sediminis]